MPGLTESTSGTRVLILPQSALEFGDSSDPVKLLRLEHPRTGEPAQYLLNTQINKIYQILTFTEEHRAWFIGEKIVEDGSLLLSTPINPIFLILPHLIKAERNVPLEDLLDDPNFPHLHMIANLPCCLEKVAKQIGDKDLNVWKYDEDKCVSWLESKVLSVSKVLKEQLIDLSGGAAALSYKQESSAAPKLVEYTRHSFGIVSEYLSPDLAEKLREKLNLPEPEKPSVKRQSEGTESTGPPAKKQKQAKEEPLEDYSKDYKKGPGKEADKSAKQKALAKSAEGTKNIMSFFKKK